MLIFLIFKKNQSISVIISVYNVIVSSLATKQYDIICMRSATNTLNVKRTFLGDECVFGNFVLFTIIILLIL